MFDRFDYESYCDQLRKLKKTHVDMRFCDFVHSDSVEKYFILRHDVDFSPAAALNMAKLEVEIGVRASYFLLFTSDNYNLLSEQHRDLPRQLVDLGHEVGLHYDVAAYAKLGRAPLVDSLIAEAEFLGNLTGIKVKSIAMHNPSIYGEDPFRNEPRFINAYADRFTKDISYLSDSCGAWRDSTILALQENIPSRFQLLIHPIFWSEDDADRWARLESFKIAKAHELTMMAEYTRRVWLEHSGVIEHDRRTSSSS